MKTERLLFGVGYNDVDRPTFEWVEGKRVYNIFYQTWKSMLKRCHWKGRSAIVLNCYEGVEVARDWYKLSNFEKWMKEQDYEGRVLDKDILGSARGMRCYSEDTCAFITQNLNAFVMSNKVKSTEYPTGASFHIRDRVFSANIAYRSKQKWLGYHKTPEDAHKAWQIAKYNYGIELLDEQTDERVKEALGKILNNLKYQYDNSIITENLLEWVDTI